MFDNVHHVQLAMPRGEEAAARAFFVDVLGMAEIDKPAVLAVRGGVWFRAGNGELHLGVEDDFRPARKAHPGIVVDDLDALVEHLAGAGQNVQWDRDFPASGAPTLTIRSATDSSCADRQNPPIPGGLVCASRPDVGPTFGGNSPGRPTSAPEQRRSALITAEEDIAPATPPCMTMRWYAADDGTLT
jgi:catechol 2,3-dioxygenase-like lactoylglutathione lyase family enzyme